MTTIKYIHVVISEEKLDEQKCFERVRRVKRGSENGINGRGEKK